MYIHLLFLSLEYWIMFFCALSCTAYKSCIFWEKLHEILTKHLCNYTIINEKSIRFLYMITHTTGQI